MILAKVSRGLEDFKVVIETEYASSSHTTACDTAASHKFTVPLTNLLCSPAFISILLLLSLATSTLTILIHTGILFETLAFLLLACSACAFSPVIVSALTYFAERCFIMKTNKALYFVFALRTSLVYFFRASSLLLSWIVLVKPDMHVIQFVTSTLATSVIATGMSMLKIVILKLLACRFHDKNFFPDLQDLIFHEYVLQTLLGPAIASNGPKSPNTSTTRAQLNWMKGAFCKIKLLLSARSHTICDALDNSNFDDEHQVEKFVDMVFQNLTNEHRDIQETDLLSVMKKEEISNVLQLFEGAAETKSISEASLRKWMVKVCNKRKLVIHLLNDTSTVIEQLNKLVMLNLSFLVALVWCFLMGFGRAKFLVFISSHLLLFVFILGNFCKMICEGIMLAIVMHPFDTGDHCIIDNEQLVVEEIGLISTVFLKDNNENVNCLNSVLLTKSIINLSRSSELRDSLELRISSTTPAETILSLKLKIDELLRSKPETWHTEHCFDLTGIDDVTHIYNLHITHATNFKNYKEGKYQRAELVLKLRMLLEELNINNFTVQEASGLSALAWFR